jgi:hypothetical protein
VSVYHVTIGNMTVRVDSLEEASREFIRVQQNMIDRGLRPDQIPRATVRRDWCRDFWEIAPTGQIFDRDGELVQAAAIL